MFPFGSICLKTLSRIIYEYTDHNYHEDKSKFLFDSCVSYFHHCWDKIPQVKEGNIYRSSQFLEILVHSGLAPSQGGVAEGHHRAETVHGKQAGDRKAASSSHLLSFFISHRGFKLNDWCLPHPRGTLDPRITSYPLLYTLTQPHL